MEVGTPLEAQKVLQIIKEIFLKKNSKISMPKIFNAGTFGLKKEFHFN